MLVRMRDMSQKMLPRNVSLLPTTTPFKKTAYNIQQHKNKTRSATKTDYRKYYYSIYKKTVLFVISHSKYLII